MKKLINIFLVIILAGIFSVGCVKRSKLDTVLKEEIVIKAMFLINPMTDQSIHQELVEEFNQAYKGKYRVEVEWLTETDIGYRNKIKQLNALDEMPAIITDVGFDSDFYELLIENNRLVNLQPYMMNSKRWINAMEKDVLQDCTQEDGSIYLSALGNSVFSYGGFIYNKELLEQVEIEHFPETWDEFWECLEQLKKHGITPLALHGSDSYWVSMLIATSYMATSKEGMEFMHQQFPVNYSNESMGQLLEVLKRLYQYTFLDALNIDYNQTQQRLFQNEAAIIANGYWMFLQMDLQLKDQYGFAPFPQNTMMVSPKMSAWAVTSGYDSQVTEGAVKFLEFRILKNQRDSKIYLQKSVDSTLDMEYKKAIEHLDKIIPNYQLKWEQRIQNDFFSENMPLYVEGIITKEDFLNKMNEAVCEINLEK